MHKLLIADDEYFIVERMKIIVDYAKLGYELIATAANGKDALEQIERLKPDLAILDIKMPFLSGLEVAQRIRSAQLPTRVILLTSYNYFEFAKQAIQSQVFSYLLKPVQVEELEKVLCEAASAINAQKNRMAKYQMLDSLQIERTLQSYLLGGSLTSEEQDTLARLQEELAAVRSLLAIKVSNPEEQQDLTLFVQKQLENVEGFAIRHELSCEDNVLCLLCGNEDFEATALKRLQEELRLAFHAPVNLAYRQRIESAEQLPTCCDETLRALRESLFEGDNAIVNVQTPMVSVPACAFDVRAGLLAAMRAGDADAIRRLVRAAFSQLNGAPSLYNLETLLSEVLVTDGLYLNTPLGKEEHIIFRVQELINNYNDCQAIEEWCVQQLCSHLSAAPRRKLESQMVFSTMDLVRKHYADPELNLPAIARQLGYTPNYISTVFKRNTGLSVVQYVTQCRMEAARKLLSDQGMPVSQVYQQVGYSNPFYFSKRFRQFYGCSPSECIGLPVQK